MERNKWQFEYTAHKLAEAAVERKAHHESRLDWWKRQKAELLEQIKAEGLEVNESVANRFEGITDMSSRSPQIMVRTEFQEKMRECHNRIHVHQELIFEYSSWIAMLSANPEQRVLLDIQDFTFFFGKPKKPTASES